MHLLKWDIALGSSFFHYHKSLIMKRNLFSFLAGVLCLLATKTYSQNVAINEDGSLPNPNAILDVKSFTKGILIPRVSTSGRLAIPNTKGLLVYDTTAGFFFFNTGLAWQQMATGTGSTTIDWSLTGNTGVTSSNFLGTINNSPLVFKVNNNPAGRIETNVTGNTFLGYQSGVVNQDLHNTGVGEFTLNANTGGHQNTAVGAVALASNTNGINNSAVGAFAMENNTTGTNNVAFGDFALQDNSTGVDNTAIGVQSLEFNTGSTNTATGIWALRGNGIGHDNTSIGGYSMINNTNGNFNTAAGGASLQNNTEGVGNVGLGYHTAFNNIIGHWNTAVGSYALSACVNGTNNTAVGSFSDVTAGMTNSTAIGAGAVANTSNKVRIGNGSVTKIEGQVPFTTPSDGRYKFKVQEDVKGLDFIMQLRPVTYQFDVKRFDAVQLKGKKSDEPMNAAMQASYDAATAIRRTGFIAQEVEKAAINSGYDFSGVVKPQSADDHYSLSYDAFVVPLVKAVQEQQKMISQMQQEIRDLKNKLESKNNPQLISLHYE